MIDWSPAIVLSTSEFEVCWDVLGLGETPWQLDPPRSGLTTEERNAVIGVALTGLAHRGLASGGRPAPVIEDHLRRLASPHWSLDTRYVGESLVTALAAGRGRRCTLAVRHGAEIALLAIDPEEAADALVDLSGVEAPGPGRDVRVPAAALDAARRVSTPDQARFVDELAAHGVPRADGTLLTAMCGDVRLRGQLGASASANDGTRLRRGAYVVGFHSTPAGRFRQVRRAERGMSVVTVGPATREGLRADLLELLAHTRR